MNTTTTTTATKPVKPVKAPKPAKAKPAATEPVAAWYAGYNAVITKAGGKLGTPITADMARAGCLIGGAQGEPKRQGVEALFLALTLRPEGCSNADFVTIKGRHGFAQNALHYASANLTRAMYGWVHVSVGDGKANISRLTPKGVNMLSAAGISAAAVQRMARPYEPKATKAPKPAAKAPAKATGASNGKTGTTTAAPKKPTSEPRKAAVTPPAPVTTKPVTPQKPAAPAPQAAKPALTLPPKPVTAPAPQQAPAKPAGDNGDLPASLKR